MHTEYTLITTEKNWMSSDAVEQLAQAAALPGAVRTVGLPDLHAGKTPVGMALMTRGVLYPHLTGGDTGCGMTLFATGVGRRRCKQDRWAAKLERLGPLAAESPGGECPLAAFGTLGGGNHFAEFQQLDQVLDGQAVRQMGLEGDQVYLLMHSGSRDFGQRIAREYPGAEGLCGPAQIETYLRVHNQAVSWAEKNRLAVADKLLAALGFAGPPRAVLDSCHNFVEALPDGFFLHRKGAVSARRGPVVIPGSRGSLAYLVQPARETQASCWSLSHGAGRKWPRASCRGRLRERYSREELYRTALGSRVVCQEQPLLYEEAPDAYKNIAPVIRALEEHGLARVIATLRPLLTYKG